MEKELNIFGKNQKEIGSLDENLVLRTKGLVYIRYGKKYIELLDKNGKLKTTFPKIVVKVNSLDAIDKDGIYLFEDNVYLYVDGEQIQLTGIENNSYVQYVGDLNLEEQYLMIAQKNIGLTFDSKQEALKHVTKGIVHIGNLLYVIQDGQCIPYNEKDLNSPLKEINYSDLEEEPPNLSAIVYYDHLWKYLRVVTQDDLGLMKTDILDSIDYDDIPLPADYIYYSSIYNISKLDVIYDYVTVQESDIVYDHETAQNVDIPDENIMSNVNHIRIQLDPTLTGDNSNNYDPQTRNLHLFDMTSGVDDGARVCYLLLHRVKCDEEHTSNIIYYKDNQNHQQHYTVTTHKLTPTKRNDRSEDEDIIVLYCRFSRVHDLLDGDYIRITPLEKSAEYKNFENPNDTTPVMKYIKLAGDDQSTIFSDEIKYGKCDKDSYRTNNKHEYILINEDETSTSDVWYMEEDGIYYYFPGGIEYQLRKYNKHLYILVENDKEYKLSIDYLKNEIMLWENKILPLPNGEQKYYPVLSPHLKIGDVRKYKQAPTGVGNNAVINTFLTDVENNEERLKYGLYSDLNIFVGGEFRTPLPEATGTAEIKYNIKQCHFPTYSKTLVRETEHNINESAERANNALESNPNYTPEEQAAGMNYTSNLFNGVFLLDEIILPKKWIPRAANYIEDFTRGGRQSYSNGVYTFVTSDRDVYDGKIFLMSFVNSVGDTEKQILALFSLPELKNSISRTEGSFPIYYTNTDNSNNYLPVKNFDFDNEKILLVKYDKINGKFVLVNQKKKGLPVLEYNVFVENDDPYSSLDYYYDNPSLNVVHDNYSKIIFRGDKYIQANIDGTAENGEIVVEFGASNELKDIIDWVNQQRNNNNN